MECKSRYSLLRTDIYVCVAYDMSKAEREMGLLLGQAQSEALKGNVDAKQSMKQITSLFTE